MVKEGLGFLMIDLMDGFRTEFRRLSSGAEVVVELNWTTFAGFAGSD